MRLATSVGVIATAVLFATVPAAFAQSAPPVYATPQDALEALMAAMATGDVDATLAAMDPEAGDLVHAADPERVSEAIAQFLELYQDGFRFVPGEGGTVIIDLGRDDWPFPVPLVRAANGWSFDTDAGREEVIDREIGRNELDVIDAMHGYVDIQAHYRALDPDGDGVPAFAARIISSVGSHDGLYWSDREDSLIGDMAAKASLDGYSQDGETQEAEPFQGYYFRILTSQGPSAPGGEMNYVINGHMVAGHALLAVPAEYGVSGIHSFIVSEAGVVQEADLGEDTLDIAYGITSYEPDDRWSPVEED
ncbi:DUF2950 family protein [Albibacillus kandeliae]|uniref:DUF2950 family protein n=1 Tax=Albibacillus kandeliae TaxID=2174228 RepID=UPI00130067BC|nr:DUF2950 family protein [Albibacillus kandeliae]